MRHATSLLYHVCTVASRNIRFASCGTSGKLTLWTCLVDSARIWHSYVWILTEQNKYSFREVCIFKVSVRRTVNIDNYIPGCCKYLRQPWKFKWHGFELALVTCFRRINCFALGLFTVFEQYHLASLMIRGSDENTARIKPSPVNKNLIIFVSQALCIFCNRLVSVSAKKKLFCLRIILHLWTPSNMSGMQIQIERVCAHARMHI
jgi:hypothetical protein